jgi:hypothetical protein
MTEGGREMTRKLEQAASKGEPPRLAYSIAEFAVASDSSRAVLYEAIKQGRLKARRHGGRTLILHSEGLAYLESLPLATADNATRGVRRSDGGVREDQPTRRSRPARSEADSATRRRGQRTEVESTEVG